MTATQRKEKNCLLVLDIQLLMFGVVNIGASNPLTILEPRSTNSSYPKPTTSTQRNFTICPMSLSLSLHT